jgi:hypothetical protein
MNNECIPLKSAAYTRVITVHCTAGVTGKKFVAAISSRQSGGLAGLATDPLAAGDGSDYVVAGPPAAAAAVEGVAMWDVGAGGKCPVISGPGTVLPVTAGAAVTAGAEVQVDATGAVVPYSAGIKVGRALSAAGAGGVDVEVELYSM